MTAKLVNLFVMLLSVIVNSIGVELDGRILLQIFYYLVNNTRSLLLDISDLMLGVAASSSSSQKSCAIL
jgi:hypothetical protein